MISIERRKMNYSDVTLQIFSGGTPSTSRKDYWGGGINWLSSGETRNRFIYDTENTITEKGVIESSTKLAQKGDTVVASAGQGKTRGQVAFIEIDTYINQSIIAIRPNSKIVEPLWIFYDLSNRYDELRQMSDTSSIRGSLTTVDFKSLKLFVPAFCTQRKIISILKSLDDKIELNRQTNATLAAIAQAIFKEWFVDFNFPGATGEMVESELGLIPEGWRVVQLGEVSDLSWGDTKTTKNSYSSEGYIAYSASGPDGYLPYYDFSRDGIVVSAIGAYSGKTWFAHGYWSCIKNTIRFWSTDDNLSNEYLYLYTSPKGFWPLRGSAQPFISQTDAREKRIIYPGNHLARYFGEVLQPLFQLIRRNDDEAFTLSQTRDSLLPKLMNGEIEV